MRSLERVLTRGEDLFPLNVQMSPDPPDPSVL